MASSTRTDTEPSAPAAPIVVTPRCIIRRYHVSDIPGVAHHANNPNVARYLRPHFPSPYSLADAETWYKFACSGDKPLSYAICDPKTNTFMGSIGIRYLDADETRTAELGYWLGEEFWGRGIVTDASREFARWVFENFSEEEVQRLEASVYGVNLRSQGVLRKAGFVYEGARRRAGFKHGEAFDILMFGLVRTDLEGLKKDSEK
ncbi:acyl-CoA N-acyltransferase [Podospora aff. communis PSN243]|uniref:Acyl-CoA N-acyltransferase n=1 Tax=Podospora aff. communis PSN243 TaxID=3040156 RepID=A0AAV9FY52_9PEZI|nr:acyl-CoA N-acyltransferase [Podospora aff. communis PSN243]